MQYRFGSRGLCFWAVRVTMSGLSSSSPRRAKSSDPTTSPQRMDDQLMDDEDDMGEELINENMLEYAA